MRRKTFFLPSFFFSWQVKFYLLLCSTFSRSPFFLSCEAKTIKRTQRRLLFKSNGIKGTEEGGPAICAFYSAGVWSLSLSRSLRSLPSSPPPFSSKILIKAPACRVLPRPRLEPRDNELRRLDESLGALGHAGLLFRGKGASRRPGEAGVPADVGDAGDGLLDLEGSFFRFAGSGLRKGGGRG